jgi:hypothetical protein
MQQTVSDTRAHSPPPPAPAVHLASIVIVIGTIMAHEYEAPSYGDVPVIVPLSSAPEVAAEAAELDAQGERTLLRSDIDLDAEEQNHRSRRSEATTQNLSIRNDPIPTPVIADVMDNVRNFSYVTHEAQLHDTLSRCFVHRHTVTCRVGEVERCRFRYPMAASAPPVVGPAREYMGVWFEAQSRGPVHDHTLTWQE